jgi:hypothetical protein
MVRTDSSLWQHEAGSTRTQVAFRLDRTVCRTPFPASSRTQTARVQTCSRDPSGPLASALPSLASYPTLFPLARAPVPQWLSLCCCRMQPFFQVDNFDAWAHDFSLLDHLPIDGPDHAAWLLVDIVSERVGTATGPVAAHHLRHLLRRWLGDLHLNVDFLFPWFSI